MKKLTSFFSLRKLMLVLGIILCEGAQGADVSFDVKNGNASQYSAYNGKTVNVTLKNRTFTAGEWTGICLPFDVPATTLNNTFKDGYEIQELNSIDESAMKFVFKIKTTQSIEAGTPYLIKVKETTTDATFNDVTFKDITDNFLVHPNSTESLQFRGFYFFKYGYILNDQNSNNSVTWIANGAPSTDWVNENLGTSAYFLQKGGNGQIKMSVETTGGSGGSDTPDLNTIAGKIAARKQLTDIPTIYIDLPNRNGAALNDYLYKNRSINYAPYRKAIIQVVDESDEGTPQHLESFIDDNLEIKARGNSTSDVGKKPYRLKFANSEEATDGVEHKHDLLGLGYKKRNWTLLANHFDRSMMRNAITYHLGKYMGLDFCPGYKFVDLVIDDEYRGTYQVSDHVQLGDNRIESFDKDDDWLIETVSWTSMMEEPCINSGSYNGLNIPLMTNIKNPDTDNWTEEQITELKNAVANWEVAWNQSFSNGTWQEYNDVESLIKFYVGINITSDYDGFFVMKGWRKPNGVFHWGPLWDKDLAYGNCNYDDPEELVENFPNGQFRWNFINFLSKDKTFVTKAKMLIDKLVDEGLYDKLAADIDHLATLLDQTQQLNYGAESPWSITDDAGIARCTFTTYAEHVAYLKNFLKSRIEVVQTKINDMFVAAGGVIPTDTHKQLTDVPTIYITTENDNIDTDDWGEAAIEILDKNNMIGGNMHLSSSGLNVKTKGDGTDAKPSYRLRFNGKQSLLGDKSGDYKQWTLESNGDDPSMLRNALTKELGDKLGFDFTPGYQFADVYVNEKYMGTYQITDRVKVEKGRVLAQDKDTDWLISFAAPDKVDTRTNGLGDLYVDGTDTTPYVVIKNPDKDDLTSEAATALKNDVANYFSNFWTNIQEKADKTSLVNWYIATEILAAYKQLSENYAYRSTTGKLFFGPLEGSEKAYDNNAKHPIDMTDLSDNGSYNGMIFNHAESYTVMQQIVRNLWQEQWFKDAVIAKWKTLYGAEKTVDLQGALTEKLDALAAEIAQTKEYNYKATSEGGAGWTLSGNYTDHVNAIKTYLDNRLAYLNQKFYELAGAEDDVLLGDADGNGVVDIMDVTLLVDHILGKNTDKFNEKNADATANGTIDIADVTAIVNIILGK